MVKNLKFFKRNRGCVKDAFLSPKLFNIHGWHIIRDALQHWTGGITIEGRRISNLRYADDATLIALDEEEMTKLVNLMKMGCERLGLRMNALKMRVMMVDRGKCR